MTSKPETHPRTANRPATQDELLHAVDRPQPDAGESSSSSNRS